MSLIVTAGKRRLGCTKFHGVISEDIFKVTAMRTPKFQDRPPSLFIVFVLFLHTHLSPINTLTAIVDLSRFNNSCLKSPASTLVDLTFQSRTLRSFSLNQLRNLSL